MFQTGQHIAVFGIVTVALIAPDHGACIEASQIRVLTEAFGATSPSRVTGNVNHRIESPVDAVRRSLNRGNPCSKTRILRTPRAGKAQWNREYCLVSVYHVKSDKKRNPQTGLLHGSFLI